MRHRPITIKLTVDQLNAYIREQVKIHLKDFLKLYSEEVIIDELILFTDKENDPLFDQPRLILEKKETGRQLKGTKYTYRIDNPCGEACPGNQRHIHVLLKNKEVFAMNVDGSAHDGYHQVRIPDIVAEPIKQLGFQLPPDNLIEVIAPIKWRCLLLD